MADIRALEEGKVWSFQLVSIITLRNRRILQLAEFHDPQLNEISKLVLKANDRWQIMMMKMSQQLLRDRSLLDSGSRTSPSADDRSRAESLNTTLYASGLFQFPHRG